MTQRRIAACALLFAVCAALVAAPEEDARAIREKILKGADAAMRADAAGIMSHYAKDIVLAYPGIEDMDYATLWRAYAEKRPPGMTMKTVPSFDETMLSGDLAVLRLNWTTTITTTDPPQSTTRQARDIQVWRREADGGWMFVRGMHFRNADPVKTSGADTLVVVPPSPRKASEDEAAIREAILRSRIAASDAVILRPGVVDEPVEAHAIHEVLVSGGLAVVRLGAGKQTRELQIWRRHPDGAWKLSRAMRAR